MRNSVDRMAILVAGREPGAVKTIAGALAADESWQVECRHIQNGHADPLYGLEFTPDALVLKLSHAWEQELKALAERPAEHRPPVVVVADAAAGDAMRLAMQAGARDFLAGPMAEGDLLEALSRIARERAVSAPPTTSSVIAFVSAKGGAGASVLASAVAALMADQAGLRTVLVDLDLHFGTLGAYLDLEPARGLVEALDAVESLDEVALEAFMQRHPTGLRLLAPVPGSQSVLSEPSATRVDELITLLGRAYERVVLDVPRAIGPMTAAALHRAEEVVVVLQQDFAHVQDASRLVRILRRELGIGRDRLMIVVNRYRKSDPVTLEDIGKALDLTRIVTVPNDYRTVSDCLNRGAPIHTAGGRSPVRKALVRLEAHLRGNRDSSGPGFFRRAFGSVLRS